MSGYLQFVEDFTLPDGTIIRIWRDDSAIVIKSFYVKNGKEYQIGREILNYSLLTGDKSEQ